MANEYLQETKINNLPRLPFDGSIDLTYRCNDNCRHCWLKVTDDSAQESRELSLEEIKKIVNEARQMGCRRWSVSGGEPMLRPDFAEIFDYISRNSSSYSLNTNGTLITHKIAQLMKRKGTKMVALYGATPKVHDHITRNPGSFEATMRGFRYLKEAGAGFTVQLIPMKDNYRQFQEMEDLAKSLSPHYRIGAAWLYLSACGSIQKNQEIIQQRLPPKEVIELDQPDLSYDGWMEGEKSQGCGQADNGNGLLASCILSRRDFHIDPYGKMSFCSFIKDPSLRYDLRKGSFQECWDEFIPSLQDKIKASQEYWDNCGSCEWRKDCRYCPVYGYLEKRRFTAKVDYLCQAARENRKFKQNWISEHRRYYKIADITIQLDSDLPIVKSTFHPKFKLFETSGPGKDTIYIRHHFSLPELNGQDLGVRMYRKPPWAVYKKSGSWVYLGISPKPGDRNLHRVVVFNNDHTRARIYNDKDETFLKGNLHSLTLFPTDQILLSRVLADRQGCYLHSCGVNFNGKGLLFAGHSEAGKSTMATLLKGRVAILCDDRIIVRRNDGGFKIYGTWSHGDVPDVSASSAPLKAIFFLEKAKENRATLIEDKKEMTKRLLACLIRPFVTADWWEKMLSLIEKIATEVPGYRLEFEKDKKVADLLERF